MATSDPNREFCTAAFGLCLLLAWASCRTVGTNGSATPDSFHPGGGGATQEPRIESVHGLTPTSPESPQAEVTEDPDARQPEVDETAKLLFEGLFGVESCDLPCVMNVTPGRTDVAEIRAFTSGLGSGSTGTTLVKTSTHGDSGGVTAITTETLEDDETSADTYVGFSYYLDGTSLVQSTTTYLARFSSRGSGGAMERTYSFGDPELLELANRYAIGSLLGREGVPSIVMVAPFPYENEPWPKPDHLPFSLVLVYEDTGFLIEYILTLQENESEYVACPEDLWEMTLVAWDPDERPGLEESLRHKDGLGINANLVDYFETIQEASGLELNEFHELFADPATDTCISAPKSLWED